jgi:hypothetical protein
VVLGTLTLGLALLLLSSRYYDRGGGYGKTSYGLRNTFALLTLLLGVGVGHVGG